VHFYFIAKALLCEIALSKQLGEYFYCAEKTITIQQRYRLSFG